MLKTKLGFVIMTVLLTVIIAGCGGGVGYDEDEHNDIDLVGTWGHLGFEFGWESTFYFYQDGTGRQLVEFAMGSLDGWYSDYDDQSEPMDSVVEVELLWSVERRDDNNILAIRYVVEGEVQEPVELGFEVTIRGGEPILTIDEVEYIRLR